MLENITQEKVVEFSYGIGYVALEKIFLLSLIAVAAHIVIYIANIFLSKLFDKTEFDPTLEEFIHKTTVMGMWILTLGIVLVFLGVDVNAIVASFGVGSFIIGFALKDTLNNFASGVMVLLNKPFGIGDVVEVKGQRGVIETISMSSITMKTENNDKVTLPNSIVWGNPITNYTAYKD